ncbi:MAG: hypothetical protein EBT34_02330 [Acetobacteraceae bacterium]|nr:hypothetical protein [Acetobacteraceae bacterium]NBS42572.1 hypothetical protein [Acetobacteraceae bacterium]
MAWRFIHGPARDDMRRKMLGFAKGRCGSCVSAVPLLSLDCIAVWFVPNFSRFFKIFLSF